jgi:hypothetical protein
VNSHSAQSKWHSCRPHFPRSQSWLAMATCCSRYIFCHSQHDAYLFLKLELDKVPFIGAVAKFSLSVPISSSPCGRNFPTAWGATVSGGPCMVGSGTSCTRHIPLTNLGRISGSLMFGASLGTNLGGSSFLSHRYRV